MTANTRQILSILGAAALVFCMRALPRLMFRESTRPVRGLPTITMPVQPAMVIGGDDFIDRAASLSSLKPQTSNLKPSSPR